MLEYTYKFKTTEQLWNCECCPLFNDEFACCNATGSKWRTWEDRRLEPRLPDCPLEEVKL